MGSGNDEGEIRLEGRKRKRKGGSSGGKNNNIIPAVIAKNGGDIVTQNSNEYSGNNSQTTAVERENTYTRRSQLLETSNNGTDRRGTSQHDATTNMTTKLEQEVRCEVVKEKGDISTTLKSQKVFKMQNTKGSQLSETTNNGTDRSSSLQDATTKGSQLAEATDNGTDRSSSQQDATTCDTSTIDTSREVFLQKELEQKEVQETILGSSQQDATTNRTTRLEQEVRFEVVPEAGDTSTTDTSQEVELLRRELEQREVQETIQEKMKGKIQEKIQEKVNLNKLEVSTKTDTKQDECTVADLETARKEATAYLESLVDNDGERSVYSGRQPQNTVIKPGVLLACLSMWTWMVTLIEGDQAQHHGGISSDGLPTLDCKRILGYVKDGVSFTLIEGKTMQDIPRVDSRNYIPRGREMSWFLAQGRAMVKNGMIRECRNPHMIHACFLVPKGDGYRLIVDFRALNELLQTTKFSLPTLNKNRYAYFDLIGHDTVDLVSGYQHLNIHPTWQKFFGIRIGGKSYVFIGAPFGTSPLPEIFQSVASVVVRINNLIGMSPELDTPKKWRDLAENRRKLPERSNRASISITQYLDDFSNKYKRSFRTKEAKRVPMADLPGFAVKLSASFRALLSACGWNWHRVKSHTNMFRTNPFIGFNVHVALHGGSFGIPIKKVSKNVAIFKRVLRQKTWTYRECAGLASRILQFKLIWGTAASMYARPLYSGLSKLINAKSRWTDTMTPSALQREVVKEALDLLSGPNPLLEAPVIDQWQENITLWEQENYKAFVDSNGRTPLVIAGDVSEWRGGAFLTTLPIDALTEQVERKVVDNNDDIEWWKSLDVVERVEMIMDDTKMVYMHDLTEKEREQSSTFREIRLIDRLYSDTKVRNDLMQRMDKTKQQCLLHATDSQAARSILQKGATSVPEIHRLVMNIMRNTLVLRREYGLFFGWLRRSHHLAEVADGLSKKSGWQIDRDLFAKYHKKLQFTLDAFASLDECVRNRDGSRIDFCSRTTHVESLGDARCTSWKGHTVWCFPPPNVTFLVEEAMQRCSNHDGIVLLVVPGYVYYKLKNRFMNLDWKRCGRIEPGNARRVLGTIHGTKELKYEHAPFTLHVFHFDNRKEKT